MENIHLLLAFIISLAVIIGMIMSKRFNPSFCLFVGALVAAVVGYACIRLLKMIAERGKFGFFAYYCWLAGAVTLALTLLQK